MSYTVVGTLTEDPKTGAPLHVCRFVKTAHTEDLPSGWFRKTFDGQPPNPNDVIWDELKSIFVPKG